MLRAKQTKVIILGLIWSVSGNNSMHLGEKERKREESVPQLRFITKWLDDCGETLERAGSLQERARIIKHFKPTWAILEVEDETK